MTAEPRRRAHNSTLPVPSKPITRRSRLSRSPVPDGIKSKSAARTRSRGRAVGAASNRPKPPGEFTAKVRLQVRTRAGRGDPFQALCEGCWRWLGRGTGEFQHRVSRGSGGCRDEVVQSPANCLLLCHFCHMAAEERRRDLSQDGAGFWIEHGNGPDYDPRFAAVMLGALGSSGVTCWLAADGLGPDGTGYLFEAPEEVAA